MNIAMHLAILLLCFTWVVNGRPDTHSRSTTPTAQTRNGSYAGVHMPQFDQDVFYGIPFANAPRFSAAESLNETWDGTRDAVTTAPSCAGFGSSNQIGIPTSENCLNLNVVRPAGLNTGSKLPVMVWIYVCSNTPLKSCFFECGRTVSRATSAWLSR